MKNHALLQGNDPLVMDAGAALAKTRKAILLGGNSAINSNMHSYIFAAGITSSDARARAHTRTDLQGGVTEHTPTR